MTTFSHTGDASCFQDLRNVIGGELPGRLSDAQLALHEVKDEIESLQSEPTSAGLLQQRRYELGLKVVQLRDTLAKFQELLKELEATAGAPAVAAASQPVTFERAAPMKRSWTADPANHGA